MSETRLIRQPLYAWLILLLGVFLSGYFALQVKERLEAEAVERFSFAAEQVSIRIEERLNTYAMVLRGGAALFDASEDVTRDEWRAYTEKLRVSDTVVGVEGIGFALLIRPDDLAQHTASVRAEGFSDYQIRPEGERDLYSSIIYLEPFSGRNLRAFAYDMFSEPVRREAMIHARDTGMAALTGRVELVQETGSDVQPGTLMYVPVYRHGAPWGSVEQRREALIGWSYSPYRMRDLMEGILGNWKRMDDAAVGITVYDQHVAEANLLYRNHARSQAAPSRFAQQHILDFNGRQWVLVFDHLKPAAGLHYTTAWNTLLGGLLLSGLLFGLMLSMANTQVRAARIADQLTVAVREQESQLRDSEFRWRFAIEGSGDGLWDWNLRDDTVFYSPQWKVLLGLGDEDVRGDVTDFQARLHPDDREETLAAAKACRDGDSHEYVHVHRMQHQDGHWLWVLDRGIVVERDDDGVPLRMLGTMSDISSRKALEAAREELLLRMQTTASRVPGMVFEYRLFPDGRSSFPYSSDAIQHIYGLSPESVREDASAVFSVIHPDDYEGLVESVRRSAKALSPWRHEYRVKFADGRVRWLYGDSLPHRGEDGVTSWYGVISDVTEQKESELALRRAHAEARRFRDALDYLSSYVYMKDTQSQYIYANRATLELFACSAEGLLGSGDEQFFPAATVHKMHQIDARVLRGEQTTEEVESVDANGKARVFLEIKAPIYDESEQREIVGILGISTDITPLKEHEQQLEHIAHFDALTNLPNRVLLADRLHQAMSQAQRRDQHLAVAYLDLDGFKGINDRYGHAAGDQLLVAIASRMKAVLREGDTLSRLGGDEFVVVLLDLADVEASVPMLSRLLTAAAEPLAYQGNVLQVSASAGISFYPQNGPVEAEQLMRQADQAMYQAKLAGKGRYHVFDAEQDRSVRSHHESLERIRSALENGEFCLYYQPKVNMHSGVVIGAEALIRWQHPVKGLLPPSSFLPVIEDHPLSSEVGEWVIATALAQMSAWQTAGLTMPVSVNVGAHELHQTNFPERLQTLLAAQPDIPASFLELEVLETSALGDLASVSRLLERCRALGVGVALDDFGTGYSSLTYLKRLPAGVVKVDQSFVRDILEDAEDLAILDGVLGLASAFGRQVIAEGVETTEHGDMLLRVGCELAQGYGIARPMPADDLPSWVAAWRPEPHWSNLRRLSREAMPLLYAGVEHRAWIRDLALSLQFNKVERPELNPHRCRFGSWLDRSGYRQQPGFGKIDLLHRQVHQLASELCELHDQGQAESAIARLDELYALGDALLAELGAYID
ncbi:MAG: EAL domain-containing protein [Thiohalomonadaceae bacterium]